MLAAARACAATVAAWVAVIASNAAAADEFSAALAVNAAVAEITPEATAAVCDYVANVVA